MSKNTCFTYTTLEGKHVFKNDNKKVLSPTLPKKEKNGANIVMASRLWLAVHLVPLFYFNSLSLDYFTEFKCILQSIRG